MRHESYTLAKTEAIKLAITKPCSEKNVQISVSGHDITFGLPDTEMDNGKKRIKIPSTPHIFRVNTLVLKTERGFIQEKISLLDAVILFGHGRKNRDDPRTWLFEDGQDVIQLASAFNSLGSEIPPIKAIISCRRVLSSTSNNKTFNSTRPPLGWKKLSGIIFQKNGNLSFGSAIKDERVLAIATNNSSDFIKVTKNGKIKNLRKSGL